MGKQSNTFGAYTIKRSGRFSIWYSDLNGYLRLHRYKICNAYLRQVKIKSVFVGHGYADVAHRNTLMLHCYAYMSNQFNIRYHCICDCLLTYLVTFMKITLHEHKFWNNYEFSLWVNFKYFQKLHAMNSCKVFLFVLIIASIFNDSSNRRIKRQGKTVK